MKYKNFIVIAILCGMSQIFADNAQNNKPENVVFHTRHIPTEHVEFGTPTAKALVREKLNTVLCEKEVLDSLRKFGTSIVETRLVWYESESKKGVLSYDRLERDMDLIEKNGLKVGVFNWFQHPPKWEHNLVRLRCLEHGEDSTIPSLWDENFIKQYDRLAKDFSEKFRDRVAFLYVGIYGDYAEVTYPFGVAHYLFSPKHGHVGLWSGDKLARADFRKYLVEKYGKIECLNSSWRTSFKSFDDNLMPRIPLSANSLAQRIDYANWYSKSLMDFTDKVCALMRRYFPNTPMGLPIGCVYESIWGGQGQLKSMEAKIAAKYGMTVRWTGLAHRDNFALTNVSTRRLSSAARFYGAKFGVEAAAGVVGEKVPAAIYEFLANSASMLHNDPNSIHSELNQYKKYGEFLKCLPVNCDIAVYYPYQAEITYSCDIISTYNELAYIRRYCDYELADELMISDGFLKTVKQLILPKDCPIPQDTVKAMREWEKNGGVIWYREGCNPVVLETGETLELGKPFKNYEQFGKNDGCFYTDHGDRISKFDPKNKTIEFIKK